MGPRGETQPHKPPASLMPCRFCQGRHPIPRIDTLLPKVKPNAEVAAEADNIVVQEQLPNSSKASRPWRKPVVRLFRCGLLLFLPQLHHIR